VGTLTTGQPTSGAAPVVGAKRKVDQQEYERLQAAAADVKLDVNEAALAALNTNVGPNRRKVLDRRKKETAEAAQKAAAAAAAVSPKRLRRIVESDDDEPEVVDVDDGQPDGDYDMPSASATVPAPSLEFKSPKPPSPKPPAAAAAAAGASASAGTGASAGAAAAGAGVDDETRSVLSMMGVEPTPERIRVFNKFRGETKRDSKAVNKLWDADPDGRYRHTWHNASNVEFYAEISNPTFLHRDHYDTKGAVTDATNTRWTAPPHRTKVEHARHMMNARRVARDKMIEDLSNELERRTIAIREAEMDAFVWKKRLAYIESVTEAERRVKEAKEKGLAAICDRTLFA